MVRLLADADFNHAIVKGCRRREPALDFLTANEARLKRVPDPAVLAFAAEQNRILVTHDLRIMPQHFGEFLMRRQSSRACLR
jgi:predicted nuclease of predicted toxin-antitoxin system